MALDRRTGWLYIVDGGKRRVLRANINSGTAVGDSEAPKYEVLDEYVDVRGAQVEVVVNRGLVEPVGIAAVADRLVVSDHSNGDIVIFGISSIPATELGRIATGAGGVMGITIGPEGRIWYVDSSGDQVVRVDVIDVVER